MSLHGLQIISIRPAAPSTLRLRPTRPKQLNNNNTEGKTLLAILLPLDGHSHPPPKKKKNLTKTQTNPKVSWTRCLVTSIPLSSESIINNQSASAKTGKGGQLPALPTRTRRAHLLPSGFNSFLHSWLYFPGHFSVTKRLGGRESAQIFLQTLPDPGPRPYRLLELWNQFPPPSLHGFSGGGGEGAFKVGYRAVFPLSARQPKTNSAFLL